MLAATNMRAAAPSMRLRCAGGIAAAPMRLGVRAPSAASGNAAAQPVQEQQQQQAPAADETLGQQLRRQACGMAAVLPLASTSFSSGAQGEIYFGLAKAVDVYLVVLTVRILLSWFRNINWYGEPFNTLRQLTDPFLSMFRGIIPAIGGIDLSPMLGFFLLNFLRGVLMSMAV